MLQRVRTLLLVALAWTLPARAAEPPDRFVRVRGTKFVAAGWPFAFVGANLEAVHGAGFRARYEETLDALLHDGLTVGRIWALGEGPDAGSQQIFRTAPDAFVEASFVQLDRVLAGARGRGLRLIITLANYWDDYGGVRAYLRWAGLPDKGFGAKDRFFADPRTRALYRAHVTRLLDRTNTVTGVRYVDDPTIFAWELMNESRVETEAGAEDRRAFIVEMARFIRSRDPNHLVTPGLLGYGSRRERAEWLAVCRLPEVDYCDSHLYPQTTDRIASERELADFIDDRVQLAHHVAKKPIVFGEFGFRTDEPTWLGRPRAAWFRAFLDRVRLDGAAGALVWIYQPWTGRARDFGIYIDRPDTNDVRAVLRTAAMLQRPGPPARNPRLGAARGEALLYNPYRVLRRPGPAQVTRAAGAVTVSLAADRFAEGRFERVGFYAEGTPPHAYGAGDGAFTWRFTTPSSGEAVLTATLSSEFPGRAAPKDGESRVRVRVDGREVATLEAIPDDGVGAPVEVALGRLPAGRHTLRLEVPPGPRANGLCVYAPGLRVVVRRAR